MPSPTVTEYLTHQLKACGKAQKQVAEESGFDHPNIISMMKQGQTKVPIEKVSALSQALGVDPAHFLRIAMIEYEPERWEVIQQTLGYCITLREAALVEAVREVTAGEDPSFDEDCLQKIGRLVGKGRSIPR